MPGIMVFYMWIKSYGGMQNEEDQNNNNKRYDRVKTHRRMR